MARNHQELLTDQGERFVEELCSVLYNDEKVEAFIESYGIKEFTGGSLGRRIFSFPNSLAQDDSIGDIDLETFYVIKASGKSLPHNYREIKVWQKACDLGWEHESLFAPIHAWDVEDYRWLIMRRVRPVSPHEGDIAYLLSGQEYIYDPDAPEWMEEKLTELGWTVEDVEMNVGVLNDGLCMMDYGGVDRRDDSIEIPGWMK
ncbi:hypothetical protein [Halorientalis marina]|uniref:hypothetical protein n=1 Tax=Halorientalis marina TaxID=2931976 RepID=UPI001FF615B0|nr:hypothetical protein [Halorientalis marina]